MSWNHRIMRGVNKDKDGNIKDQWVGVYEVYSGREEENKHLIWARTESPIRLVGNTEEDLLAEVTNILKAFEKTILDVDDYIGKPME